LRYPRIVMRWVSLLRSFATIGAAWCLVGCGDAGPPAPALCSAVPDRLQLGSVSSGCGTVATDTTLAARDGAVYFVSKSGLCASDASGTYLLAAADGADRGVVAGPWLAADGVLDLDRETGALHRTPFAGGERTVVADFHPVLVGSIIYTAAYDGRYVYVPDQVTLVETALWRVEPGGTPEQIGTVTGHPDGDRVGGIVPTESHVDTVLDVEGALHRLELADGSDRALFASPTHWLNLLGGDGDVAYVNDELPSFSYRERALARIDGSGNATGAFGPAAPPRSAAAAVQVTADQVFAGVGLSYAEGAFLGVVTLPRTGIGGDLVFCMPDADERPREAVRAIAVDGDTVFASVAPASIVRFHR
jgi:hypothetical protein